MQRLELYESDVRLGAFSLRRRSYRLDLVKAPEQDELYYPHAGKFSFKSYGNAIFYEEFPESRLTLYYLISATWILVRCLNCAICRYSDSFSAVCRRQNLVGVSCKLIVGYHGGLAARCLICSKVSNVFLTLIIKSYLYQIDNTLFVKKIQNPVATSNKLIVKEMAEAHQVQKYQLPNTPCGLKWLITNINKSRSPTNKIPTDFF
jgi:hypothetical protein